MDHLQRQTRPADSILVIDNASQDNSLAELAPDPALTIHRLEENVGFAAANNLGGDQLRALVGMMPPNRRHHLLMKGMARFGPSPPFPG